MRTLGLDVGERRIGVSISDPNGSFAVPHSTITRDGRELAAIRRIVDAEEIGLILIGLPVSMNGEEGAQAETTRRFGTRVETETGAAINYWDERLSSVAAERLLGAERMKTRERVDALAATLVLQSYLDSLREPAIER